MLPRRIPKPTKRATRWRSQAESLSAFVTVSQEGRLFWKHRPRDMFRDDRSFCTWNARFAEREAFTTRHSEGYLVGTLFGEQMYAHRIVAEIVFGSVEDAEIDHINGNRSDNRPENLRVVNRQENRLNCRTPVTNSTGVVGVYRARDKWRASIQHDGMQRHIGTFESFAEAVAARRDAEVNFGFHANHGRR